MSLIRINSVNFSFGAQEILNNVSCQLNPGDHIALVGANGTGKTTLLRLIGGFINPHSGMISRKPDLKIGYLPQNPEYPEGRTAWEEVYAGLGDLIEIQAKIKSAEQKLQSSNELSSREIEKQARQYADLLDRFHLMDGDRAEAQVEIILDGLGVPRRIWHNDVTALSGGERNLIGLARILVGKHDVLLLDEPGNHLDFSGLDWLENYLSQHSAAFILVSHNRYTLDRTAHRVWELERAVLTEYTGNYSEYRSVKLERSLSQEAAFRRAQKDINRLQFNIQRLKAWGSVYNNPKLARTAKVFERRVEELQKVERPQVERKKMRFRFLAEQAQGRIALDAKGYRLQLDDGAVLLDNVDFGINQGERVAFVGDNGTGKSSLLKRIISEGNWENPTLRIGKSVSVGYYSQLGENLNPKATLIDEAMRLTGMLRGGAESLLHRFLFTRDDLEKTIQVLSGGETARLQLAALVVSGADMLLLDEPTNHLDIASREAVEDALEEYPGTLILVSHDRYFLDKLADRVLHFVPPKVIGYEGNFSEFWQKRMTMIEEGRVALSSRGISRMDYLSASDTVNLTEKPVKTKKPRLKFDPALFKQLEEEIHRLEQLRPEVEEEYDKLQSKGKTARAERRRARLDEIDRRLKELYHQWAEIGDRKRRWN